MEIIDAKEVRYEFFTIGLYKIKVDGGTRETKVTVDNYRTFHGWPYKLTRMETYLVGEELYVQPVYILMDIIPRKHSGRG